MTDLERRVVRLERRLRVWQVAAVVAVGIACKQAVPPPAPQAPPPAPPTQLDFRSPDGQSVHVDATGIYVSDKTGTMKIQPSRLDMTSGKSEIQLWIHDDAAHVLASYDGARRFAALDATQYYSSVDTAFLPDDHVSPPNGAQVSADKDGGTLDIKHGDAKKTYK